MLLLITLDKNGKFLYKEEKADGFVPKKGYEKGKDGNFYKKLGDPRFISYIERQKELKEQQKNKVDTNKKLLPDYKNNTASVKRLKAAIPITYDKFKFSMLSYKDHRYIGNVRQFYDVKLLNNLGFIDIPINIEIAKIAADLYANQMIFWFYNFSEKLPDLVISNIFTKNE